VPTNIPISAFIGGIILMLFIYWGWDTAVSVNEETRDKSKTPGQAAIISTLLLLATYALVIFAVVAFAGTGSKGIGLANTNHGGDVLSVLGSAIFGSGGFGTFLSRLLLLMVLSSAAASTQTTILPTARTTLSMAVYRAYPKSFAKIHRKYLTPTVSTIVMGAVSIVLYAAFNYISGGNVIPDAVSAIGVYIAFYYGLTAGTCVWYYRKTLTSSARNLWMRGILPGLGWLIMWAAGIYSLQSFWTATYGSTFWTVPGLHWEIGGIFLIALGAAIAGLLFAIYMRITAPPYFKGETLTRSTPTLVPDK
jgi:amino acid transporter